MEQAFSIAALWFGLALLATFLASKLKISIALMEILVGIAAAAVIGHLIGKDAMGADLPWLKFLASTGAVLFTFLAGAELEPSVIRRKSREVSVVGAIGFLGPFLGCTAIARFALGWPPGFGRGRGTGRGCGGGSPQAGRVGRNLGGRLMQLSLASIGGSHLETFEHLSTEAGASHLAAEARTLAERVREGLFYAACVGQFKRGKSTLLNAIVRQPVLPVGVVPVTAVVTVVRHGEAPLARVRFAAGGWQEIATSDLAQYVTEEQNPENRKGVASVEVFVPSELLRSGMCLVDTPGIGSVFIGNTEATRAFVPHVDTALVVLGADSPISADELALVNDIAKLCESTR
jgi:hypothetical protein